MNLESLLYHLKCSILSLIVFYILAFKVQRGGEGKFLIDVCRPGLEAMLVRFILIINQPGDHLLPGVGIRWNTAVVFG